MEWGGFSLLPKWSGGGLQRPHCKRVRLLARGGNWKCALQLYACLMWMCAVIHLTNAPWNLRDIENVSYPYPHMKIPIIFYPALKHYIWSIHCCTRGRSFSFIYLLKLLISPHNCGMKECDQIQLTVVGVTGKKRKKKRPWDTTLHTLRWQINTNLISKSGKKVLGSALHAIKH